MLRDIALRVGLDKEVEVALIIVGGDWGIGAHDLLGGTLGSSGERDMLADGEAEDIGGLGQGETVDCSIVGNDCLLLENEVLELHWLEDFAGL